MSGPDPARRVVQLLNSTAVGGAEMVALQLGTRLQEMGWTPEVVTLRGEGGLSSRFREAGMPVHDLAVPPGGGVLAMRRALRGWLHVQPALTVLHSHNVSPLVATALAAPGRRGFRWIHTKHGRARARNVRGRLLTRWAAHRADALVAVSRDAAERAVSLEGYPADRVHLIYNGIAADQILPRQGEWSRRLVVAARLEPVKRIDLLLHAMARLRDRFPDAMLTVVGDGSERPALERLAAELALGAAIRFVGWKQDVGAELRAADCFVLPSRSEGLSMTVLEAMATGLPVVTTRVGGNPEVVEDDVTGVLIPHSDPDALAGALARLLADPHGMDRMGRAGRERVLARFSLRAMAEGYHRLYLGT